MTYEELKQLIQDSSKEDWLYDDSKGIYTSKNDLNVTIRHERYDDPTFHTEEWANQFSHPASRLMYDIYYGASFIESFYFIALDEYRAEVPIPRSAEELVITRYQYSVARIVDRRDSLDQYMQRAGITVE